VSPSKASRRRRWAAATLLAVLVGLALATQLVLQRGSRPEPAAGQPDANPFVREFSMFGTYGRVTFWAPAAVAEVAWARILTELQAIHDILNNFDPKSELSRLNREAHQSPFRCSDRLWDVLLQCRRAWSETDGAFDISVGPLMHLWGFHQKRTTYPAPAEVQEALAAVGLSKVVVFDDAQKTVRLLHPKACLDMGGMAKGYALDRAMKTARTCGIRCALIDLGGNVGCLEEPPPGRRHYSVGIRNPVGNEALLGTVRITDCAVATSGNYENYLQLDGKLVHHIVDPRTGYPVPDVASVTVITPLGIDSDVYSTAVFVAGDALVSKLRETHHRTSVLIVRLNAPGKSEVSRYGWVWEEYTE